jgi:hypothetical protein
MIALIAVVGLSHRSKQIDRSGDVATTPFQLGNVLKLLFKAFASLLKMALILGQIDMHRAVFDTSHLACSPFEINGRKKPDLSQPLGGLIPVEEASPAPIQPAIGSGCSWHRLRLRIWPRGGHRPDFPSAEVSFAEWWRVSPT